FQTGQPFSIYDSGNSEFARSSSTSALVYRPKFSGSVSRGSLIPDPRFPNTFLFLPLNNVRDNQGNCLATGPFFCSAENGESLAGTLSRNIFRRPGTQYHNLALAKSFAMPKILGHEGTKLQLRAEFYNIFNHSNLYVNALTNDVNILGFTDPQGNGIPGVTVRRGNSLIGSANTAGLSSFIDNRQVVIGLKFTF